jgi:hypothetical protein
MDKLCHRCKKRIAEAREFMDAMREVRKLPIVERHRKWWQFKDSVCICTERIPSIVNLNRIIDRPIDR